MMKVKWIEVPIWGWAGRIIVGGTCVDYTKWANRHLKADAVDAGAGVWLGHAWLELGLPWAIWCGSLADTATLAHEALHITSGILGWRGLKLTDDSEEAYTYTMTHIIREALKPAGYKRIR